MNPLDKIKEGVNKQDWDLVCEGYNSMTGQDLSLPTQPDNPLSLKVSFNDTTIKLFKRCMQQMIDEFEFVQEMIDEPDTEDYVGETCDISQPVNDGDIEQPVDDDNDNDDDDENVEFDAITESKERVGLFGNTTMLISEKPNQSQVEANQARVAKREKPRVPRPSPKTYKVKCTDCEKPFESRVKTGEFGQKCPKCLRSMRRDR